MHNDQYYGVAGVDKIFKKDEIHFKYYKNPTGWMNSWMKEFLQKEKRKY